jgi:hypothetical protein
LRERLLLTSPMVSPSFGESPKPAQEYEFQIPLQPDVAPQRLDPILHFTNLADSECSPPGPGSLLSVFEPEMVLHCAQPLTSWASMFVGEDHDLTASSNATPVDRDDNTAGDGNPIGAGQEESVDVGSIQHGPSPTIGSPCDQPLLEATVAAHDQA